MFFRENFSLVHRYSLLTYVCLLTDRPVNLLQSWLKTLNETCLMSLPKTSLLFQWKRLQSISQNHSLHQMSGINIIIIVTQLIIIIEWMDLQVVLWILSSTVSRSGNLTKNQHLLSFHLELHSRNIKKSVHPFFPSLVTPQATRIASFTESVDMRILVIC